MEGAVNGSPVQKNSNMLRNFTIGTGVALGATAVILAAVALSKIGTLREGIMRTEGTANSAVAITDTLRADQKTADSTNAARYTKVKKDIWSLKGEQGLHRQSADSRFGKVEARVEKAEATLVKVVTEQEKIKEWITQLQNVSTEIKSEIGTLTDGIKSLGEAQEISNAYLKFNDLVNAWNSDRGGFLGIGKRQEMQNMSPEEFRTRYDDSRVSHELKAHVIFNQLVIENGEKPRK